MSTDQRPPVPAANDEQSALANLKALLLGPEQASIESLQRESHDREVQVGRVSESLPESLHKAYADTPQTLTRALEAPVSACIEDSVRRNPGFFADILFPIMGPAIRRSISQALKGLVQQINQTLEHSLTLKGLKWRVEAARSGVPFGEVVLRNTLRYRVEEAFLIQSGSGLLIQHASEGPAPAKDADAVSAMLTALRDFTRDTLRDEGEDSRLETIDVGDHTLWLVHGPRAYLACAIRGMPPVSLRDDLAAIVEEIHRRHGRLLEGFDGDQATAVPLIPLLERCLLTEVEEPATRRLPWPLVIAALVVAGLIGWWVYGAWQQSARHDDRVTLLDDAARQLGEAPGIVVTERHVADEHLHLGGLYDPLLTHPEALLQRTGLSDADYTLNFRPYQSSDAQAALARARQRLAPPDSVELSIDDEGVLQARGSAADSWIDRAELLATTVPGIEGLDTHGLEDIDLRLVRQLRAALQPPDTVSINVDAGAATLSGTAPLAWVRSLPGTRPGLPGLVSLDSHGVEPLETGRLTHLVSLIDEAHVPFEQGIDIGEPQQARIDAVASLISEAHQHASDLGMTIRVRVIGRTDGTGTIEQNHFVASRRAEGVARALNRSQLPMPAFDLRAVTQPNGSDEANADLRRVEFQVTGVGRQPATQ